ncbi:hypothetical protein BDP27DRAFT_1420466 [Rhodocollybia butyracea]|uniref:Uncharacterized protein n=1 Tax=Rhodocollybia butyracea TaxID=206335 RepID=A0A9P5PXU4_9AGAR|nr:hypothetical protein BDP27DRAFT_1420466 [Rhodocollybia butyracea]
MFNRFLGRKKPASPTMSSSNSTPAFRVGGDKATFTIYYDDATASPPTRKRKGDDALLTPSAATKLMKMNDSLPHQSATKTKTDLDMMAHCSAHNFVLTRLIKAQEKIKKLEQELQVSRQEYSNMEGNYEAMHASLEHKTQETMYRSIEHRELKEDLARTRALLAMSSRLAYVITQPSAHARVPGRTANQVATAKNLLEELDKTLKSGEEVVIDPFSV